MRSAGNSLNEAFGFGGVRWRKNPTRGSSRKEEIDEPSPVLPRRRAEEFRARNRGGVPAEILAEAAVIVERVRSGGEEALREYTTRFEDCTPDEPLYADGGRSSGVILKSSRGTRGTASSVLPIGSEGSPSRNAPH